MTSRIRQGARGLVLEEDDNVLLVPFDWGGLDVPGGFWACPGGGIEDGEPPEAALRFTELGQAAVSFSPRDLATQVEVVLADGVPPVPRKIECLPWGHDSKQVVGEREW